MKIYNFTPQFLKVFFDKRINELCKFCKRYGKKSLCPPNLENSTYYCELLTSFKQGELYTKKFIIEDLSKWKEQGKESSLIIHNAILERRNELFSTEVFSIGFGAGSCKWCSEECTLPCKFPEKSLVPIEATGLDLISAVELITNKEIEIKFPVEKQGYFYRMGAIFY